MAVCAGRAMLQTGNTTHNEPMRPGYAFAFVLTESMRTLEHCVLFLLSVLRAKDNIIPLSLAGVC